MFLTEMTNRITISVVTKHKKTTGGKNSVFPFNWCHELFYQRHQQQVNLFRSNTTSQYTCLSATLLASKLINYTKGMTIMSKNSKASSSIKVQSFNSKQGKGIMKIHSDSLCQYFVHIFLQAVTTRQTFVCIICLLLF